MACLAARLRAEIPSLWRLDPKTVGGRWQVWKAAIAAKPDGLDGVYAFIAALVKKAGVSMAKQQEPRREAQSLLVCSG